MWVDTLPGWMQPIANHQPVTAMCNAVRALALGAPALAGLRHTTGRWVLVSLAWAAGITVLFAPLMCSSSSVRGSGFEPAQTG